MFKVWRVQLLFFIGAILLFFFVHRSGSSVQQHVNSVTSVVVYPFLKMQHFIFNPIYAFTNSFHTMSTLQEMIAQLHEEKEALIAQVAKLESTKMFADETDELRHFKKRYKTDNALLAQVVSRNLSPTQQFFLVDAGSRHGITQDMVAVYKNCLVGKVSHVYPFYAQVKLITDPSCHVAAVTSSTRAHGIHVGNGKLAETHLNHVSHLQTLKEDDSLFSSGQGLVFPKGFVLGKISMIQPDGVEYQVTIKPVVDFSAVQYCYLIAKGDTGAKTEQPV